MLAYSGFAAACGAPGERLDVQLYFIGDALKTDLEGTHARRHQNRASMLTPTWRSDSGDTQPETPFT